MMETIPFLCNPITMRPHKRRAQFQYAQVQLTQYREHLYWGLKTISSWIYPVSRSTEGQWKTINHANNQLGRTWAYTKITERRVIWWNIKKMRDGWQEGEILESTTGTLTVGESGRLWTKQNLRRKKATTGCSCEVRDSRLVSVVLPPQVNTYIHTKQLSDGWKSLFLVLA